MVRLYQRCLSVGLGVALAWPSVVHAHSADATDAPASDSVAILGLEGNDAVANDSLTASLRRAFAAHGLVPAQDMSLVEFRLTMGCEGEDLACFGDGARALEVDRLIYGSLDKSGGGYTFKIRILDVAAGEVVREGSQRLSAQELMPDNIDATAEGIVATLVTEPITEGTETGDVVPALPPPDTGAAPPPRRMAVAPRYVWGRDTPAPTWKKAALGASAALTGIALGTAVGLSVALRTKLRDDLLDAVDASANDTNPIDRSAPDLCAAARKHPEQDTANPGSVTNARVTKVCNRADGVETGQYVAWAATGVFAATTIVFTTLLFVKKNGGRGQALRRHGLRLGAGPTSTGWSVAGGFRF